MVTHASATAKTPGTIVISAVTVMPEWRGRGLGRALTIAAMESESELPSVLSASELGFGVYDRLGFETPGRFTRWSSLR